MVPRKSLDFLWLKVQGLKPGSLYTAEVNGVGRVEFLTFKGSALGGLCTPLGTICIHERLLRNHLLKELVLIHEYAHKKDFLRFIFYSTGILVLFFIFFWGLLGVLATIALTVTFSWILELRAEIYTVKLMGKKYFEAKAEAAKLAKKPVRRLLSPPKSLEKYVVNSYRAKRMLS